MFLKMDAPLETDCLSVSCLWLGSREESHGLVDFVLLVSPSEPKALEYFRLGVGYVSRGGRGRTSCFEEAKVQEVFLI